MKRWPFDDPENVAVFTSRRIIDGTDWIYYVTHDADDGAWQFHPYSGPTPQDESIVVSLKTIVDLDDSVCMLADLPIGWHAWRDSQTGPWRREIMRG